MLPEAGAWGAQKWQKFLTNHIFMAFKVRCTFLYIFMFLTILTKKLHQKPEKMCENTIFVKKLKILKNWKNRTKSILAAKNEKTGEIFFSTFSTLIWVFKRARGMNVFLFVRVQKFPAKKA